MSVYQDVNTVCLTVRDHGGGIDPADAPHVFDRFYRADESRSRDSGGSGLGLAIVATIAEAHGGDVSVDPPTDGEGASITLTLPTYEPEDHLTTDS